VTVVERVRAKSRRSVDSITSTPTLVTSAVQAVRESIYDGRLGPGARLVEADLAQQLGISRGPLREALHLLGKEGLVVTIPRHSKFVQNVDSRSVDEVYSLRKILEAYAVERVIAMAGKEGVNQLRRVLAEMREAAEAGNRELTARLDVAFHSKLYDLAQHSLLERAWYENIAGKLQIVFNATRNADLALKEPVQKHELIVKAIASRNVERAQTLLARHIDDAWHRAQRTLKGLAEPSSSHAQRRVTRSSRTLTP
jgi:DNA-binding GntR family transcriptional regulator